MAGKRLKETANKCDVRGLLGSRLGKCVCARVCARVWCVWCVRACVWCACGAVHVCGLCGMCVGVRITVSHAAPSPCRLFVEDTQHP